MKSKIKIGDRSIDDYADDEIMLTTSCSLCKKPLIGYYGGDTPASDCKTYRKYIFVDHKTLIMTIHKNSLPKLCSFYCEGAFSICAIKRRFKVKKMAKKERVENKG